MNKWELRQIAGTSSKKKCLIGWFDSSEASHDTNFNGGSSKCTNGEVIIYLRQCWHTNGVNDCSKNSLKSLEPFVFWNYRSQCSRASVKDTHTTF